MIWAIVAFFVGHWALSVFFQTFFLHRYGAHRMFTMSKGWERFFHLMTYVCQGASYLDPRAYAILHREHHAFSDTEKDPHSPHTYPSFFQMMWATKVRYHGLAAGEIETEARFEGGYPEWRFVDWLGDTWVSRIGFGALYTLFYLAFAPHWAFFLLLPIHYFMGPIHGAIVNWGGHKYGYRNFDTDDKSVNSLPFDFLTGGELFQNNHHRFGMAPNFAVRWFELDPSYQVIRVLSWLRIIDLGDRPQTMRWEKKKKTPPPPVAAVPILSDAE
jgi:stearoyl-CoA desaturase (delta-9 desaturase)